MGRPKKFKQRKKVSVIFESQEHDELRLKAAQRRQSVSEFIRLIVMSMLKRESAERQAHSRDE